ncbi:hypothetical protein LXL04_023294 [Taraxacum kok-saghyz]
MNCRILGEIHVRIFVGQLGRHLRLDDATDVCSYGVLRSHCFRSFKGHRTNKNRNCGWEEVIWMQQQLENKDFAMTINKTQGQTIPNVGVYLPESVVSHDQLYVGLSGRILRENTKVLVKSVKEFTNEGVYTSNVVYSEVLHDI